MLSTRKDNRLVRSRERCGYAPLPGDSLGKAEICYGPAAFVKRRRGEGSQTRLFGHIEAALCDGHPNAVDTSKYEAVIYPFRT